LLDVSSSFKELMLLIVMYEVTTILAYCPNPGTKQHNGVLHQPQTGFATHDYSSTVWCENIVRLRNTRKNP
jgi:hypothetical protein